MNLLPLVFYVAAGVAYALHFARRVPAVGRTATTLLLFGVLLHTFVIGMETMEVRHVPFADTSRLISTFVWLLALSYLYLELTTAERAMGVFILPIVISLQTIPVLVPGNERQNPIFDSPWFWIHVSSLLFAYASFGIGCVLGMTYMLQFKEIKKKHLGFFYTRLPALHVLDAMNARAMAIGWLFLTIGVGVGVVWTAQARMVWTNDPTLQAIGLNDPKVFIAVFTWIVYSFALVARRAMGWTGRRAAWLSAIGFVIVLLNFVPVSYFVPTSHSF